jgi:hypothetical protein
MDSVRVEQFWKWFVENADAIASGNENRAVLSKLDSEVTSLDPGISWEIGPGTLKPWQLVISPNLNRVLRETTRAIVAASPPLREWEFLPSRTPKDWNYKFELRPVLGDESVKLDASGWTFVLLKYPDGSREILLHGSGIPALDSDQRWHAAAIALESVLGEDVFLDTVDEFELVDELEPRFLETARPIQSLQAAVMGSQTS